MTTRTDRGVLGLGRWIAGAYLIVGLLGIFLTGFDYFSNITGVPLFVFTVNPLTNIIHLAVGVVGTAMTTRSSDARRFLLLIGALGIPWAVSGYFLDGTTADYFARNPPLVNTHLATALVALVVAWNARPGAQAADRRSGL